MKTRSKKIKINKRKMFFSVSILVLGIILVLIIALFVRNNFKSDGKEEFREEKIILNFEDRINKSLEYKYEDYLTVGWLQVQGTNIDFPVLNFDSANDGDIDVNYLYRSSYYESGENREVIVGHNIINVSSVPIRNMSKLKNFEALMTFTYEDFAKENLYISYTKNGKKELYKIYAAGFYEYVTMNEASLSNLEETKEYIKNAKQESIYDYNVDVNENDKLISLKTCTRYFGLDGKGAFIIDARKVREDEEIIRYEVKTNKNYNQLSDGVSNENL